MKVYILTGICVVCIVTLLLTKYVKHRSGFDKIVRITVTFLLIQSLLSVVILKVLPSDFEILDFISPFVFMYGPLLFLALQYYEENEQKVYKPLIWHSLPFCLASLLFISVFFALLFSVQLRDEFFLIWYAALGVSFCIYSLVVVVQMYSKMIDRRLYVFSGIAVFLFTVGVLAIGITVFRIANEGVSALSSYSLLFHLLTLSYLLLWYFRQIIGSKRNLFSKEEFSFKSNVLDYIFLEEDEDENMEESIEEFVISSNEILNRIDYLSSNLNISVQAKLLRIDSTDLASVIKEETGLSYNNFINKKRIDFITDRMAKDFEVDLDDLIEHSGFNSKASFYRNFKRYTGETPHEFISKYKNTLR